jgi:hypothetical protein
VDFLLGEVLDRHERASDDELRSLAEGFEESGGYASFLGALPRLCLQLEDRDTYTTVVNRLSVDFYRKRPIGLGPIGARQVAFGYRPGSTNISDLIAIPAWARDQIAQLATHNAVFAGPPDRVQPLVTQILDGRPPAVAGLQDTDADAAVYGLLNNENRPDLAEAWLARLREHWQAQGRARGSSEYQQLLGIAAGYIRQGKTPEAIRLFRQHRDRFYGDNDYVVGSFPDRFAELVRQARGCGDQAGVQLLADEADAMRKSPAPPGYITNYATEDWHVRWFEPLRLAGRGPAVEAEIAAIFVPKPVETTVAPAPRAEPGSRALFDRGAGTRAAATIAPPSSGPAPTASTINLVAKLRAENRNVEGAFEATLKADYMATYLCHQLATTFASLGDFSSALAAVTRSRRAPYSRAAAPDAATAQKNAKDDRVLQRTLALVYGEALAERFEETAALDKLREMPDDMLRWLASCAYLTRRSQVDALTPDQRAYLRTAPPL